MKRKRRLSSTPTIIRQGTRNGTVVFVMGGMRSGHSLWGRRACNLFKRREVTIQLRNRLLHHPAVTGVAGRLQLLREAFPGKFEALAFPVALLLVRRDRWGGGFPPPRQFSLLFLSGLL